jgi:hypothetical protein
MHPYIIVLGSDIGSRIDVQQYLDTIEEIEYWFSSLPNCIFCVSSLDAHQIADKMKDYWLSGILRSAKLLYYQMLISTYRRSNILRSESSGAPDL